MTAFTPYRLRIRKLQIVIHEVESQLMDAQSNRRCRLRGRIEYKAQT